MDKKIKDFVKKIKKDHDDNVVDRANYATTVYILGFFAMLIMAKQYVGSPLECWVPAEYKEPWEDYIESYCFIENTYYVNGSIPVKDLRRQNELRYYQWIPYILAAQALICYAPKFIFKMLYSFSDLRITDIVRLAYTERKKNIIDPMNVDDSVYKKVAQVLEKRNLADRSKLQLQFSFNWYLTAIYFLMKILFVVSIILQFSVIHYFMATTDIFWGFSIVSDLVNGRDWRTNGYFPRVTFCDLSTRDIGQSRPHTIQCVLMINMFIEKIYIFLWFWFFAFFIITLIDLLIWTYRAFSRQSRLVMVEDALALNDIHPAEHQLNKFIDTYLKLDGVVMLRLIDSNAGYVHMADILKRLWHSDNNPNHTTVSTPASI